MHFLHENLTKPKEIKGKGIKIGKEKQRSQFRDKERDKVTKRKDKNMRRKLLSDKELERKKENKN